MSTVAVFVVGVGELGSGLGEIVWYVVLCGVGCLLHESSLKHCGASTGA